MSSVFDRVFVTDKDLSLLKQHLTATEYSEFNNDIIRHTMIRVNTLSSEHNVDSFILKTIADPLDTITYTSSGNIVDLNVVVNDAGYF